jgi:hypothetical protein
MTTITTTRTTTPTQTEIVMIFHSSKGYDVVVVFLGEVVVVVLGVEVEVDEEVF